MPLCCVCIAVDWISSRSGGSSSKQRQPAGPQQHEHWQSHRPGQQQVSLTEPGMALPVTSTYHSIYFTCLVFTGFHPALVHGHPAALFMAILCVQPCVMAVADCVNCLAAPNVWCCLAAERQQPTEQI